MAAYKHAAECENAVRKLMRSPEILAQKEASSLLLKYGCTKHVCQKFDAIMFEFSCSNIPYPRTAVEWLSHEIVRSVIGDSIINIVIHLHSIDAPAIPSPTFPNVFPLFCYIGDTHSFLTCGDGEGKKDQDYPPNFDFCEHWGVMKDTMPIPDEDTPKGEIQVFDILSSTEGVSSVIVEHPNGCQILICETKNMNYKSWKCASLLSYQTKHNVHLNKGKLSSFIAVVKRKSSTVIGDCPTGRVNVTLESDNPFERKQVFQNLDWWYALIKRVENSE